MSKMAETDALNEKAELVLAARRRREHGGDWYKPGWTGTGYRVYTPFMHDWSVMHLLALAHQNSLATVTLQDCGTVRHDVPACLLFTDKNCDHPAKNLWPENHLGPWSEDMHRATIEKTTEAGKLKEAGKPVLHVVTFRFPPEGEFKFVSACTCGKTWQLIHANPKDVEMLLDAAAKHARP